jgi:hypothetical protein
MINEHTRQDLWMQKHLDGQIKKKQPSMRCKSTSEDSEAYIRSNRSVLCCAGFGKKN